MNILILNTLYYPFKIGGAENSVKLLAENLAKEHNVSIVSLTDLNHKCTDQINGVMVHRLPIKNIYWPFDGQHRNTFERLRWHFYDDFNINYYPELDEILDGFMPDVVHTNNLLGFSVSIWKYFNNKGIPIVHTARDYYLLHRNTTLYKNGGNLSGRELSCRLYGYTKRKHFDCINHFVGISDFIKNIHESNITITIPTTTIYNAIDTSSENKHRSPKSVGCKVSIGYLGRLAKEKGVDDFVDAARLFDFPNYEFVIAGEGDNIENLPENVRLIGKVEKDELFSQIDLLVVPSRWNEPFGRVILEAAVEGIPVVASRTGGIAELFEKFHIVGSTFSTGDSRDLAKEIKNVIDWYVFTTSNNLESSHLELFDSDIITSQYIKIYQKLVLENHTKKGELN
ncbi:glycosyltransferase family 4 protein [Vibrio breoganii]|uniref:glycosyltransferase family 4 protein n=1 Tax=Vibrio breoganii TaxID=553239 RepID=UPI000C827B11|nr:glycosyltransferase family 4 protein [Vibrio breoganii]PMM19867.1 hypothetical protein BCT59_08750 [Vibrio breoganii]